MSTRSPEQFLLHRSGGLCPCCNGALQKVQRDLLEIKALVATPLPESAWLLDPIVAEIRSNGRSMLDGLRRYFEEGVLPTYPTELEESIARFGQRVDKLFDSAKDSSFEAELFHGRALHLAFARLAGDIRELINELDEGFKARP
jgi:hypothetical protein